MRRCIDLVGPNCRELYKALQEGKPIGVNPFRIRDLAVGEEVIIKCDGLRMSTEVLRTTNNGQYIAVLRKIILN